MPVRTLVFALALLPASMAAAHSSLVPHTHPHGDSPLLSLEAGLGAGLAVVALIAGVVLALRTLRPAKSRARTRRRS